MTETNNDSWATEVNWPGGTGRYEGWVCEAHPDKPFPHDDCAGPGMPSPEFLAKHGLGGDLGEARPATLSTPPPPTNMTHYVGDDCPGGHCDLKLRAHRRGVSTSQGIVNGYGDGIEEAPVVDRSLAAG